VFPSIAEQLTPWSRVFLHEQTAHTSRQANPHLLWNLNVQYRVLKNLSAVAMPSSVNPIHTLISYFLKIYFNIILSLKPWCYERLFPSGFGTKMLYACVISPVRARFPILLILLDLIILIISGEEFKLWRSSLCSFLQPPVTLFVLGPNVLLSIQFSDMFNLCPGLKVRHTFDTHTKQQVKL
jgi:hypothetical protein